VELSEMRGRVLVIDDDAGMCDLLQDGLGRSGFQVVARTSASEAVRTLEAEDFDAVVTDLSMPGMNGTDLCRRVAANRPDIPVIVITAFGSLETATAAIRAGAYDFITKPLDLDVLALALDRAVRLRSLKEEVKRLHLAASTSRELEGLLGESAPMRELFDLIARVARSEASVLLSGETGTGKELAARAIHRLSRRAEGAFVAINCAAVPEALLESELFGHARGAFTGAVKEKQGLFLEAAGGTLFLDEVADMPRSLQPKLLRALQERSLRPVGGDAEMSFDARIVAATNRDLEEAVAAGSFRKDLYFRLDVIQLEVPPLRARGNDVLLLAQHFTQRCAARAGRKVTGISSAAAEKLLAYPWPGNVRELENAIERAVALTGFDRLAVQDLPTGIQGCERPGFPAPGDDPAAMVPLEEIERAYILRVIDAVGRNKARAARILGLDRKTLYRKLRKYAGRRIRQDEEQS
jgi:two-component system response regulator HydG